MKAVNVSNKEADNLLLDLFRTNNFGKRAAPTKKPNRKYLSLNDKDKQLYLRQLINLGANPNECLIKCISVGTAKEFDFLLQEGADCNYHNQKQEFPLLKAIQKNNFDIIKILTQTNEVNVYEQYNNMDLLSFSLYKQNFQLADLLIRKYNVLPSNKLTLNHQDNSFLFWIKNYSYRIETNDLQNLFKWIDIYSFFVPLNYTNIFGENYKTVFNEEKIISYISSKILNNSLKKPINNSRIII